jgi:ACS family glucarate transporter-like MFS transporter
MFKKNFRWMIIAWLVVIGGCAYADRVNFSMAAPLLSKEFGFNSAQLGIIMSAFTFGYLITNFPGGFLVSRFSSRVISVAVLLGWSIMTIFTGLAWSFTSLIIIRIIFGLFEGPYVPTIVNIVGHWAIPEERGTSMALSNINVPAGIILGNFISSFIIPAMGWRSVFFIFGGVGVLTAVINWFFLRDKPDEHPWVSKEEKEYIKDRQISFDGEAAHTSKGSTISQILKNPWSWVIFFMYFAMTLIFWANVNWLPTYFVKERGSNLFSAGMFSSLPWFAISWEA